MADETVSQSDPIVTREEARALGQRWFFTGQMCRNRHIARRNVGGGACQACARDQAAAWRLNNPEAYDACEDRRYAKLGKPRIKRRRRRADEPALAPKRRKESKSDPDREAFYFLNRERVLAQASARRAESYGAEGEFTATDILWLYHAQRAKCAGCREYFGGDYQIDHIQPLARGGSNFLSNIQLLCINCNSQKGHLDPIDFAQRNGLLL